MSANFNTLNPATDGWSGSGNFQVITNGLNYVPAKEGLKALVFNAGQTAVSGSIEQSVAVTSGLAYRLTYWLRHDGGDSATTPGTVGLKAQVIQTNEATLERSSYLELSNGYVLGQWYQFSIDFWAKASPIVIRFTDISTGTSKKDISIDAISMSGVKVILGVEKNGNLTNAWQPVAITSDMITPDGKLNTDGLTNGNSFYRLRLETASP